MFNVSIINVSALSESSLFYNTLCGQHIYTYTGTAPQQILTAAVGLLAHRKKAFLFWWPVWGLAMLLVMVG